MAPTPRPDTVPLLIFLTPPGILCSSTPAPWLPVSPLAASFFVTIAFLLRTVARFRRRTRQQAAAARAAAAGRLPHTLAHAAACRDLYPLNSTPLSLRLPPTAFLKLVSNFFALSLLGLAPSPPAILSKKESKAVPLSLTTLLDVKPKKKSTSFAADVRG